MRIYPILLSTLTIATFASVVHAAAIACPDVANITQTPHPDGGFYYTAAGAAGKQWVGENPMSDEEDLRRFVFVEAYIHPPENSVTCDYTIPDRNQPGKMVVGKGVRMFLGVRAKKVGNAWSVEQSSPRPRCAGGSPSRCTFDVQASNR